MILDVPLGGKCTIGIEVPYKRQSYAAMHSMQIFHSLHTESQALDQRRYKACLLVSICSRHLMAVTETHGLISEFVNICRTPRFWANSLISYRC